MQEGELPDRIGHYRILRLLGRGAMGTVYLGRQDSLARDLAIKVLAAELTTDREFIQRFQREGLISSRLRHPNIVQVYDYAQVDRHYYIAMEYVGPTDLQAYLKQRGGKLPITEAVPLIGQILSALECAHQAGVTHRDVKPANVLLSLDGRAVLTDFSIASLQEAQRLTQTGAMVGTPDYMAPELFDAKHADHRADLYAVGIMLYEMTTGERPLKGDTVAQVMRAQLMETPIPPVEVVAGFDPALSELILKALQKEPAQRFADAREMREALERICPPPEGGDTERTLIYSPSPLPPPPLRPDSPSNSTSQARKKSGTIEMARKTLGEVGEDFSEGFDTVFWRKFSHHWLGRLLVLEGIWYILTRLWAGFLPGDAQTLTYLDLWMLGSFFLNAGMTLLCFVRVVRKERLYRKLVAGLACALLWGWWAFQYQTLQATPYRFGMHAKAYFLRLKTRL